MFASKDTLLTRPSGYTIARSVRLRSSATAYFNRTPSVAGNRRTYTFSAWVKRGLIDANYRKLIAIQAPTDDAIRFNNSYQLEFYLTGTTAGQVITNAVYRDPSAWYHFVVAVDTTQATASNRVLMYVNGVQVTSFSTASYPTQNHDTGFNTANLTTIGQNASAQYFDGYLTEINFIDGQALTPSSFGETDSITGVWKAKKYGGTYGTNGFYLNFSDNSSTTTSSNVGIGKDFSGNGNYWTSNQINVSAYTGTPPNNVSYDSMVDSPTVSAVSSNYCVGNPLDNSGTLSSGNLTFVSGGSNQSNRATFQLPSSGKFYAECTLGTTTSASVGEAFGYATVSASLTGTPNSSGKYVIYADSTGAIYSNGSTLTSALGTFASGTILQIAYDGATGNAWVGKNNTWYNSTGGTTGDPSTGANPTFTSLSSVFPFTQGVNGTQNLNFGQRPFTYTPPTGFVALNTWNLPDSTIKNGAGYMAATTYTGNGSTQTVNNSAGFYPDFNWIKSRNNAGSHVLVNSVVGGTKQLFSNLTDAEQTNTNITNGISSSGIALGNNSSGTGSTNQNTYTYVLWQWLAGGGTSSSNTNGSITSTVSVGATQGFSVVTYTGNSTSGATVGHGLGVAPSMVIVKARGTPNGIARSWFVYHSSLGGTQFIYLDLTSAAQTGSTVWNNTNPSSTVFTLGNENSVNMSANNYVAYCFAAVAGFSAFGSYSGNGSADGVFVHLGFRPRFVMVKNITNSAGATNWTMQDSSRNGYNPNKTLYANASSAEDSSAYFDILSNGFKVRDTFRDVNTSGDTYVYACFSENPFKYALAR